jgi:hypothetical protein
MARMNMVKWGFIGEQRDRFSSFLWLFDEPIDLPPGCLQWMTAERLNKHSSFPE